MNLFFKWLVVVIPSNLETDIAEKNEDIWEGDSDSESDPVGPPNKVRRLTNGN